MPVPGGKPVASGPVGIGRNPGLFGFGLPPRFGRGRDGAAPRETAWEHVKPVDTDEKLV